MTSQCQPQLEIPPSLGDLGPTRGKELDIWSLRRTMESMKLYTRPSQNVLVAENQYPCLEISNSIALPSILQSSSPFE